ADRGEWPVEGVWPSRAAYRLAVGARGFCRGSLGPQRLSHDRPAGHERPPGRPGPGAEGAGEDPDPHPGNPEDELSGARKVAEGVRRRVQVGGATGWRHLLCGIQGTDLVNGPG